MAGKNKVLNQDEINELLNLLEAGKSGKEGQAGSEGSNEDDVIKRSRKIKILDFKRPDIVGKGILRKFQIIMEEYCLSLNKYFSTELEFPVTAHLLTVDQLTREEFVHCCATPSFAMSSKWLEGLLLLNMNPGTFLGKFLGRRPQKKRVTKYKELTNKKYYYEWKAPSAFEKNIFQQYFAEPMLHLLESAFQNRSEEKLPDMSEIRFETKTLCLPYSDWINEMGVLATIELSFADGAGSKGDAGDESGGIHTLDLFFNQPLIETLCWKNVIAEKETNRVIDLERPMGNVIVELGRCRLSDDFELEKNMVLELASLADEPLAVFINDRECWKGEAVCIDDSKSVRICKTSDKAEVSDFYNTRVIFGWTSLAEDKVQGLGEGSIIELVQQWYEQVLIYKNDRLIAKGKVVVLGENFAVKINKLCQL